MSSRFVYQNNQYGGDILPCTLKDFNRIVDSQDVAWRIAMRQQVENAIAEGLPLDGLASNDKFQSFCQRHSTEASFKKLTTEQKLQQSLFRSQLLKRSLRRVSLAKALELAV